jgi:flagellar protein FlaI
VSLIIRSENIDNVGQETSEDRKEEAFFTYTVEGAKVEWRWSEDGCKYVIIEPKLNENEKEIMNKLINEASRLYLSIESQINHVMTKLNDHLKNPEDVERVKYWVNKRIGYGEITVPLLDPNVEEIECRGPGFPITVILRNSERCMRAETEIVLRTEDEVRNVIERLAIRSNKPVSLARPYLEFALPEGHRVTATVSSEISLPGSTFDIRKFPKMSFTIIDLIRLGTIDLLTTSYLWFVLNHKPFIIILGPSGSGKTTLMNALLDLLNPEWKILTIEDTPELNLHNPYWVRFIARKSFDPSLEVSLFDLAMLALRYRPDFLVIGEVRGREIEALVHSATSGHGTITTFHGLEPSDVLVRVNALLNRDIAHLFVTTITNFVTVTDVVENGERKRKVVAVYEKSFERGKKFLKLPLPNPNEVTESEAEDLVSKSGLIRKITESMGKPTDYAVKDILRRAEFLKGMVEKGADVNELQKGLKAFYGGG